MNKYNNIQNRLIFFTQDSKRTPEEIQLAIDAAKAIQTLIDFREKIMDGHIYIAKDGVLYDINTDKWPMKYEIKAETIKEAEP